MTVDCIKAVENSSGPVNVAYLFSRLIVDCICDRDQETLSHAWYMEQHTMLISYDTIVCRYGIVR